MNDRQIQDLVDSYLLRQISPENKTKLLDMMEADPVFAQYVKEGEETFRVLQAARDRELRNKLKAWDAGMEKKNRGKGRGLLFLFLFVSLVITCWCWLANHFSPVTMATHSFNAIHLSENRISEDGWQKGIEAFRHQDFEKAFLVFKSLPETDDQSKTANIQWNILLCQLAMNGSSKEWLEDLIGFSKIAPEPIRTEAEKLSQVIQSPIYTNLYRGVLCKTITSVKPKII